jgi:hypothetical protein
MGSLDLSQFPPEMAALLYVGSGERSELQWQTHQRKTAKTKLDLGDDIGLFGRAAPANDQMVSAVRSLLYLWNGYPAEAAMLAEGAPDRERNYLIGFVERQLGHIDRAKSLFREAGIHPIHPALVTCGVDLIGDTADPIIARLRTFLESSSAWEAFLFADVFGQALARKVTSRAEWVVGRLQQVEFELLFCHCHEQATGKPLQRPVSSQSTQEQDDGLSRLRRLREKQRAGGLQRPQPSHPHTEGTAVTDRATPPKPSPPAVAQKFTIACPKCGTLATVPESARGEQQACKACGVAYRIPKRACASVHGV